jgi:hypothetical protein
MHAWSHQPNPQSLTSYIYIDNNLSVCIFNKCVYCKNLDAISPKSHCQAWRQRERESHAWGRCRDRHLYVDSGSCPIIQMQKSCLLKNLYKDFIRSASLCFLRWTMSRPPCAFELHAWKSPRGWVNKEKLKFTKLITTTSRVSVRNIIESEREGAKQIASE